MEVKERNKKTHEKMESTPADKKRRLGSDADLPLLEKVVYFVVYSTCFAIALYKIYKFPLG